MPSREVHIPPGAPPPPCRDRTRFSPLFVLSPARSFTSVVTTMIGRHPGLADLPELKLFAHRTLGELQASLPRFWAERGLVHRSPGLVRAFAQLEFGSQTVESLALAQSWLRARPHWSGAQVLDVLLTRLEPRAAVEKSPENILTDAAPRRLRAAYPRARYLHLTRHPLTTLTSTLAYRRRIFPSQPIRGEPMNAIAAWLDAHGRVLDFAAALPNDAILRVRAEDVLNNPRATLRAIAEWLGVATDATAIEAMRHPELSPFACQAPADCGIFGGHDPGFLSSPVPRRVELPRTIQKPPGWQGESQLWAAAVECAHQLGY